MGKKEKSTANNEEKEQQEILTEDQQNAETLDSQADLPENEEESTDEIEELQGEIAELKDKNLRLRAEFDNFRRRTMQEMLEKRALAAQDTLAALLPSTTAEVALPKLKFKA